MCFTALMLSAAKGQDLCARVLIEANANLEYQNTDHVTALNVACFDGQPECAMLLLRAGARADVVDRYGDTPQSIAKEKGLHDVLALMR